MFEYIWEVFWRKMKQHEKIESGEPAVLETLAREHLIDEVIENKGKSCHGI